MFHTGQVEHTKYGVLDTLYFYIEYCICFSSRRTGLFGIREFYSEGENVSIVCRNFNRRPGFLGREVWTNSSGNVVGNYTLQFMATKQTSGLYTGSVPTVPDIPAVSYNVLVSSK